MTRTYKISELALEFGITSRTIRHYEDKDLLRPRRKGQNRIYSQRDHGRLFLILRGKRVGFQLDEIKEMLDLYDNNDGQVAQMRTVLARCRERIATLERQKQDIEQVIAELRGESRKIEDTLGLDRPCPDFEVSAPDGAGSML